MRSCAGMALMETGGPLIRVGRATGRRVWTLEKYKETCVNPGPPHKDTAKEPHAAGQLINLPPPPDTPTLPGANGGGGRAVGASPSAPPATRPRNGPEEDEVLANCPSLTSLTQPSYVFVFMLFFCFCLQLTLAPSGWRYRSVQCRISRLKSSFFSTAIRLLNRF